MVAINCSNFDFAKMEISLYFNFKAIKDLSPSSLYSVMAVIIRFVVGFQLPPLIKGLIELGVIGINHCLIQIIIQLRSNQSNPKYFD